MSINRFLILISMLLLSIYIYYKPVNLQTSTQKETPDFSLENFVIYEITQSGIGRFFEGKDGERYKDRYEVSSAKFSDNSKKVFESIRSDHARYQDNIIYLSGNVHYVRSDGLEFRSQEGIYDKKRSLVQTKGDFVITQDGNRIDGTRLRYSTSVDTVSADQIHGSYQLH